MGTVLVLCPTSRDRRELANSWIKRDFHIIFYEYPQEVKPIVCSGVGPLTFSFDPEYIIADMVQVAIKNNVDGVISSNDYPGTILASIVSHRLGLPGPLPTSIMSMQHKYYARCLQQHRVPLSTPHFIVVDPCTVRQASFSMRFPAFVKPVRSVFSIFAHQVNHVQEFLSYIATVQLPNEFIDQCNWFMRMYSDCDLDVRHVIVEQVLTGVQSTLEGFVYKGEVSALGIVDSHMFSGTISFKEFRYPSVLPHAVQERMKSIAMHLIVSCGLDNTLFNIEFMYDEHTDTIGIIEVNPRISSQFADLFEKVDGVNTYAILLAVSVGEKPLYKARGGGYTCAASFVLRTFTDCLIRSAPHDINKERFFSIFPDARLEICAREGQKLSDVRQDGNSFRYGVINLGGASWQELEEHFCRAQSMLPFVLVPVA